MKKTLILAVLVGLLAPSVSLAQISTNLKYGQRNSQVYELQDFLVDKGFLNSSVTGFFGLMTLKAVKAYQTSEGLPSTGFVGIMTRSAINAELALVSGAADEAELAETGATTSVSTTPRQTPVATTTIIERIIERPVNVYVPVPQAPVVAKAAPVDYELTGPIYICNGDQRIVRFTASSTAVDKLYMLATSTRWDNPDYSDPKLINRGTAHQITGVPVLDTGFRNEYGSFNYVIKALSKNGPVLAEKSGVFEVTECN